MQHLELVLANFIKFEGEADADADLASETHRGCLRRLAHPTKQSAVEVTSAALVEAIAICVQSRFEPRPTDSAHVDRQAPCRLRMACSAQSGVSLVQALRQYARVTAADRGLCFKEIEAALIGSADVSRLSSCYARHVVLLLRRQFCLRFAKLWSN